MYRLSLSLFFCSLALLSRARTGLSVLLAFFFFTITIFSSTFTHAQTAQYSSAVLSDFTERIQLKERYYVIEDVDATITRTNVETIIRSGKLHGYLSKTGKYNMGYSGKAAWLIFPISSISSYNNWKLTFGTQFQGRYSPLKTFSLYDMNSGKYLYQTDTLNHPSKIVPETFRIEARSQSTTYLIAYVKSAPAILTILSPEIINPRYETPFHSWETWIVTALSLAGLLTLLTIYKTTRNASYLFLALIWGMTFIRHLFVTNFLYVDFIESDMFIPMTWIFTPFLILGALWTSPGAKDDLPPSLIIGAACLFMISSITGLILMQPMPNLSTFLIYGPIGMACLLAAFSTWPFIFAGHRTELLCLASSSLFLGLMIIWICLISLSVVKDSDLNLMVSEILLCFSIICSAIFSSGKKEAGTTLRNLIVKNDSYDDDPSQYESSPLKEAKELSEHKRLIQVLEKERQNMADMQLQAARQTDEMRKSKEMADEANRAKSAFLAIVSHEIRTPMTGIMGMIRLLQDTHITKEQREYVSTIKDSGDAMLALLNDILDYEKIESGKMDLEIMNCDIRRLARSIHTLMSGHAASKNVDLILELDPSIPTWVKCDPTRLRQVILNLLNNAIKFTGKGSVYLRIRNLTSDELSSQGIYQLYFAVQDSGIGISPEAQKKLFMPFSQASTSISRKYGGTGLGLAICKRLIETMGGGISISSKENEGSTFFFTLNLPSGEEESEDQLPQQITESIQTDEIILSKPLHILIVDDNGINQKVVAGFVGKLGCSYKTASNGQECLSLLSQDHFDLILMDIELPDMNGMEVTQKIRNLNLDHKASIPIVALTGNVGDDDLKAYFAAGMNDFAPKPIIFEKIAELLLKADHQMMFPWNLGQINIDENTGGIMQAAVIPETPVPVETPEPNTPASNTVIHLKIPNDDVDPFVTVPMSESPPVIKIILDSEDSALIETNTDFLDIGDLSLNEEDEDSFALAVRRFEEQEALKASGSSTPSTSSHPHSLASYGLDEYMLKSLTSGLPPEVMKDILVTFYEKADELIASIGTAYVSHNLSDLKARAHELKGMAGNFGFSEISRMCATIENAAKNNVYEDAKEPTEHLGDKYAVARNRLAQWLEEKK